MRTSLRPLVLRVPARVRVTLTCDCKCTCHDPNMLEPRRCGSSVATGGTDCTGGCRSIPCDPFASAATMAVRRLMRELGIPVR